MSDLTNPTLIAATTNGNTLIDHNLYTRGKYSIHANYSSGLRIFNTENVGDGELEEIAFFDIRPENDDPDFEGGAWSSLLLLRVPIAQQLRRQQHRPRLLPPHANLLAR